MIQQLFRADSRNTMSQTLTVDFSKPIRLFPLAKCILLPHATVPLHIFEPRYRAMVRDALDADGLIAMATFDGEDYIDNYHGNPPIREHVCVGYIVHHERLMDGRYNILLQGIARATVHEEVQADEQGYRCAVLRPTEQGVMEIDLEDQRHRLEQLLDDKYLKQLASIRNVGSWMSPELPSPVVVDLAWQAASRDAEQRYGVLAEPDVFRRFDRLEHYLTQTRRTLAIAAQMRPCLSDTGLPMN